MSRMWGGTCCCWWEKESTTEKSAVAEEMGIWVPPPGSAWGFRLRRRNVRRAAVGSLETQVIYSDCVGSQYEKSTNSKCWRGNPLPLLVGMQIDTATVENSMEVSLKTRNKTPVQVEE